jgi:DNA-directed RNA polymerase sigma subunit (sigma70/sigma32)
MPKNILIEQEDTMRGVKGSGVSRESIRQMQKNALRKARRLLAKRGYKAEDFFDIWTRRTNNVR